MIAAEAVGLRRGGRALLADVSVALRPGEVLVLAGPNGAGKSTLLKLLAGEVAPDAGRVTLGGTALPHLHPRDLARRRAVMGQHATLSFPMPAEAVVALGRLPWHGTAQAARDQAAIATALREADVAHLARRAYATLSGGERQRVQLARALAQLDGAAMPAALLLDEPTASLDAGHRAALLRRLRHLAGRGLAVLVVLHDLQEAAFVADRVALLEHGRLIACGPPAEALEAGRLEQVYGLPFRHLPGIGPVPLLAGTAAALTPG
ncbi:heme ABC transporter ATP-binding protein [Falsiroseomonas selenitidurans]|uniref:Heme ABC transporter ATP-binding protein n=1 Tax=Falsiroseomonas selenitidurans TaxID=2716335 RepID=A0ABX1DYJ1_9PROT|nr:heme ABC transporter ATP-binding protein [Falsiroseomonas selenitidurans]NKC29987.1 heme ABC transporter ATP-binding protein [Falsiroseomonas selenitidurans]